MLTRDQERRVIESIQECDKIIDREMTRYSERNRNHNLVSETKAHKAKLQVMLAA